MSGHQPTDKQALQVPRIAWPTVALFVAAVGLWAAMIFGVHTDRIALGWGTLGATIALYLIFTPMHDAAHKSASSIPWINESLGRLCGWLYFGFFGGFRHVHLAHHKHTNDPGHDPDHWVGRGPAWALPLRWMTLDLRYHYVHARHWREQTRRHQVEAVVTGVPIRSVRSPSACTALGSRGAVAGGASSTIVLTFSSRLATRPAPPAPAVWMR